MVVLILSTIYLLLATFSPLRVPPRPYLADIKFALRFEFRVEFNRLFERADSVISIAVREICRGKRNMSLGVIRVGFTAKLEERDYYFVLFCIVIRLYQPFVGEYIYCCCRSKELFGNVKLSGIDCGNSVSEARSPIFRSLFKGFLQNRFRFGNLSGT